MPYDVNPPASTQVDEQYDPSKPTYYVSDPGVQIMTADLDEAVAQDNELVKEVELVERTAVYDHVYLLNLNGDGYTEIARTEDVAGVKGSTVMPTVREFEYAELGERTVLYDHLIRLERGRKDGTPAYYTRKDFHT